MGSPSTTTVTINGPNDQPTGSLQFNSSALSVNEDGASIRIYVTRTGGSFGAASVNFATANGTAVAGSDYTATSGTLNWSDGDSANKYFDVAITDDSAAENAETFAANLSGASGATMGSPSTTTVTINGPNDQPVLLVTPSQADFGQVAVGSISTRSFLLQNTSGGTIAGNATVSSPFSIFSGGAYSIPAGQSNVVIVQYSPGAVGAHSNNVTFTGGVGAVRPVTGQAFSSTSDTDGDGMTDWQEIIAGTSPSNAASVYQSVISTVSGQSNNITIYSGSPTFTNRLYDASWSSNLVGGWVMLGLDVPGRADNQPVPLVVTNGGGVRFFRTSVKLPPSP
jgi:hypothetical protein